jgi:hypothetical protein
MRSRMTGIDRNVHTTDYIVAGTCDEVRYTFNKSNQDTHIDTSY